MSGVNQVLDAGNVNKLGLNRNILTKGPEILLQTNK